MISTRLNKGNSLALLLLLLSFTIFGFILIQQHITNIVSVAKKEQEIAFQSNALKAAEHCPNYEVKHVNATTTAKTPVSSAAKTTARTLSPQTLHLRDDILKCIDRSLQRKTIQHGIYWVVQNFVRGSVSTDMGCAESITYTTHGDYTFFDNLPTLVKRWIAPISFAVYAPGYDLDATLDGIQFLRNCLPESALIRQYVTFHIFFPRTDMPMFVPKSEEEVFSSPIDCNETAPYYNVDHNNMYKTIANLTYPINVGRNIARQAVNTYFIFASDIELYPSLGLVQQFIDFVIERPSAVIATDDSILRVFPMPVFEIALNVSLPASKMDLMSLIKTKQAIPFHARVCKNCHLVPKQDAWYNATGKELSVLTTTKRLGRFRSWEPFYISDNREPIFDERVTWEGQSNKRIQGYAMCLLDYEYHVLHPAFLVHSPGIKKFNKKSPRLKYVPPMNSLIKEVIKPEYKVLYGQNEACRV